MLYFRCNALGVYMRSLLSEVVFNPIGDSKSADPLAVKPLKPRVVVAGREVGTYDAMSPNIFVINDIRNLPTTNEQSFYERLINVKGGYMKLEVAYDTYYKFDIRGIDRALRWCTDTPIAKL